MWGSHSDCYEEFCFLGYSDIYRIECQAKFQRNGALLATCFMNVSCLTYSSSLKMEAIRSSETSVEFKRATRRYIPEDRPLQHLYFLCFEWSSQGGWDGQGMVTPTVLKLTETLITELIQKLRTFYGTRGNSWCYRQKSLNLNPWVTFHNMLLCTLRNVGLTPNAETIGSPLAGCPWLLLFSHRCRSYLDTVSVLNMRKHRAVATRTHVRGSLISSSLSSSSPASIIGFLRLLSFL
jgi:hypothetical protein